MNVNCWIHFCLYLFWYLFIQWFIFKVCYKLFVFSLHRLLLKFILITNMLFTKKNSRERGRKLDIFVEIFNVTLVFFILSFGIIWYFLIIACNTLDPSSSWFVRMFETPVLITELCCSDLNSGECLLLTALTLFITSR